MVQNLELMLGQMLNQAVLISAIWAISHLSKLFKFLFVLTTVCVSLITF
jgi:hypothetical protein